MQSGKNRWMFFAKRWIKVDFHSKIIFVILSKEATNSAGRPMLLWLRTVVEPFKQVAGGQMFDNLSLRRQ